MKKILAVAVCGFVAMAVGCSSTKTDASAGMVGSEKKACCASEGTCTDKAKAEKAAPGMVAGEKKAGCCAGGSASSCTEKKAN